MIDFMLHIVFFKAVVFVSISLRLHIDFRNIDVACQEKKMHHTVPLLIFNLYYLIIPMPLIKFNKQVNRFQGFIPLVSFFYPTL